MVPRLVAAAAGLVVAAPGVAHATSPIPLTPVSIGMTPASPRAGGEVRLTGGAGIAGYAWDLDGDGHFDDATGAEVSTTFPAGTHTVRAQAVTAVGLVTDSRTFTVNAFNVAPAGTVAVTPYSARVGVPVTVTTESSDADGLRVTTALDLDGDGTFETSGAKGTATFATTGERVIRARFTDDGGATSVATTTLDVHARNLAPTAYIGHVSVLPESDARSGWRVSADDPDGEIARYEFDADGDGTFELDGGSSPWVPVGAWNAANLTARVTDDGGAVVIARRDKFGALTRLPAVAQVGVPVRLTASSIYGATVWDADGDGDYDDGTGNEITFTYPVPGTYTVKTRSTNYGRTYESDRSLSVREPEDIAVPKATWGPPPPARAETWPALSFSVSATADVEWNVDLDEDGQFDDAPANAAGARWNFTRPTTIALRATDSRGRSAVTTTQVPFVPGALGPSAIVRSSDVQTPVKAAYARGELRVDATEADGTWGATAVAWDADGDGEFDDSAEANPEDAQFGAEFGVRVTNRAGVSTTLRRTITPIGQRQTVPLPKADKWLRLSTQRPRLATLLRRGLTVKVTCAKPKCKTTLKLTVDRKTARKLKLRTRTVATKTVSGTRSVRVTLTPKAKRALARVKSVKLTLTAKATAQDGTRSSTTKILTVKQVAARS